MLRYGSRGVTVDMPATDAPWRRASSTVGRLHVRTEALYWRRRLLVLGLAALLVALPVIVGGQLVRSLSVRVGLKAVPVVVGMRQGAPAPPPVVLRAEVEPAGRLGSARLTVDGRPVVVRRQAGALVWRPATLAPGRHTAVLSVSRAALLRPVRRLLHFTVAPGAVEPATPA